MNSDATEPNESALSDIETPPPQTRSASRADVWLEVCAVLAVGVIPQFASAVALLGGPPYAPLPRWSDALLWSTLSACNAFVVVYLIKRSGELWSRFGLVPAQTSDVVLGVGLFVADIGLWTLLKWILAALGMHMREFEFARARGPLEWAPLFVMMFANSVAEEFVVRAYLVTRFEQLLSSKWAAVFFSTALFASYHCYQGAEGVLSAMIGGAILGSAFLVLRRIWPVVWAHTFFNLYCYSQFNV